MDLEPTEEAIEAAWKAFWGDFHQIEKADMAAAINAATSKLVISVWNAAIEKAEEAAKQTYDDWDLMDDYCKGVCDASVGIAVDIRKLKKADDGEIL